MRKPLLLQLGLLLMLLAACQQKTGDAGVAGKSGGEAFLFPQTAKGEDCSLAAAWEPILALGLRRDTESAQQLAAFKARKECAPEIRKLAEVLLDDRVAEHQQHPERAAQVRFKNPDLESLHLKKQASQPIVLEAVIDARGQVTAAQLVKAHSDPKINEKLLEAARNWLFRPAKQGDAYVECRQTFSANIHVR